MIPEAFSPLQNGYVNMLQVLDIIMWSIGALHANIDAIKPTSKDSIMS